MGDVVVGQVADFRTAAIAVLDRLRFFRQAGVTFDGKRDVYQILGYKRDLSYKDYRDRYARGGVAGTIVDALPNATWRGEVEVKEDEKPDSDTVFEKAWKDLDQKHQIQAKLARVDKLSRLSTYAVLLIGAPGELETELPRGGKLLFLQPWSGGGGPTSILRRTDYADDANCTIETLETSAKSERFGLPLTYRLRPDGYSTDFSQSVHWTRIIHIAENVLENDIFGQPALERPWNLLDDLDKVTGGGSEAFWMRANAGLHLNVDKDTALPVPKNGEPSELDKLKDQAEAYVHQLTRMIRTRGVEVNQLGSDVANFNGPADTILTQISGAIRIPKRILTGSEMGELASSQDRDNWKDQVNGRQTGYAGPYIMRRLIDRLVEYGYLPTPAGGPLVYEVKWPHIQTLTEQEKVEGAKGWATVNQTQGMVVFTGDEIRDKWAGKAPLTEEQKQQHIDDKQAAAPIPPPGGVVDPKTGKPLGAKVLPFGRAAQEAELLHVLEAAITANNVEVIDRILGLERSEAQIELELEDA